MDLFNNWQQYIEPERLYGYAIEYGSALILTILIFVIGRRLAKWLTRITERAMARARLDPILITFLGNIVYGLLLTFVVIAALSRLGVETTSLAAVVAAAGLAIGLSLQSSLSNLAAGVMIIIFRPFKVGDYIEAAGTSGTVEEVNIFTSHLRTPDNRAVILPNSAVTTDVITNYSAKPTRRIDLIFGIGYDDDILTAKKVLESVLAAEPRILADPKPMVAVSELADSSINFVVRPWVKSADYWDVRFSITESVKLQLDSAGISIPYPQRDVHVHQIATSH